MKLRNKKTGKIIEYSIGLNEWSENEQEWYLFGNYDSIDELKEEWEDYEPVEPIFDEKIRRGIRAWWDMQDNPFKAASVYCDRKKDLDGFYHWHIYGYIANGEQKEATILEFRTNKLYEFTDFKDYTKEELCGEEEE